MHDSVDAWVGRMVERHHLAQKSVIEFGSYDVNGSVRHWFNGPYFGVDLRDGPGVDRVYDPNPWSPTVLEGHWDVIVCTETLEHAAEPWYLMEAMSAVAYDDAHLLLTCRGFDKERGFFPVHDYPADHWRMSRVGLVKLLRWAGWCSIVVNPDPEFPGWFAHAVAA